MQHLQIGISFKGDFLMSYKIYIKWWLSQAWPPASATAVETPAQQLDRRRRRRLLGTSMGRFLGVDCNGLIKSWLIHSMVEWCWMLIWLICILGYEWNWWQTDGGTFFTLNMGMLLIDGRIEPVKMLNIMQKYGFHLSRDLSSSCICSLLLVGSGLCKWFATSKSLWMIIDQGLWMNSASVRRMYPPTPADARGSAPGNKTFDSCRTTTTTNATTTATSYCYYYYYYYY